ncbi:transcription factor TFIIIB subunit brf1, partial [Coemansia sp. RSA 1933]
AHDEKVRLHNTRHAPGNAQNILRRQINELEAEITQAVAESAEGGAEGSAFDDVVDQAVQDEINVYLHQETLRFISRDLATQSFDPDVSTWTDLDDDEVQNIMLNEEEVRVKSEIWDRENKEFVEEQERKRVAREQESSSRKRRRSTKKRVVVAGATPLESAQNMLATRRLSKKINYDVLGKLLVNSDVKPKVEHVYGGMIPSGAPSRMPSAVGSPTSMSGFQTPTQLTLVNSSTHKAQIDRLPSALARISAAKKDETETIIYEEDEHNNVQSTVVEDAKATAGAAEDEDDDDDYDEEEEELYADAFAGELSGYEDADSD